MKELRNKQNKSLVRKHTGKCSNNNVINTAGLGKVSPIIVVNIMSL